MASRALRPAVMVDNRVPAAANPSVAGTVINRSLGSCAQRSILYRTAKRGKLISSTRRMTLKLPNSFPR